MKRLRNLAVALVIGLVTFLTIPNVNALEVTSETELKNAILNANDGEVITLKQNVTLTSPIETTKRITIDGNNFTIKGDWNSTSGNQSLITALQGSEVTLNNVTLSNSPKYGVHVYDGGKAILNGVTIKDCNYGGILINAGTIEIRKLTLGYNGATENNGIEISKSKFITSNNNPTIIMNGTITSDQTKNIIYLATDENDATTAVVLENTPTTTDKILVDKEEKSLVVTDENDYVKFESNKIDDNKLNNITGDEVAYITLTFKALNEEEIVKLPLGTKLTEEAANTLLEEMKKACTQAGYEFSGFYQDEKYQNKFDLTKEFTQDTTIYIKLTKQQTTTPENGKEEIKNPDTADINIVTILSMIVISGIGVTYTIKKRKFN